MEYEREGSETAAEGRKASANCTALGCPCRASCVVERTGRSPWAHSATGAPAARASRRTRNVQNASGRDEDASPAPRQFEPASCRPAGRTFARPMLASADMLSSSASLSDIMHRLLSTSKFECSRPFLCAALGDIAVRLSLDMNHDLRLARPTNIWCPNNSYHYSHVYPAIFSLWTRPCAIFRNICRRAARRSGHDLRQDQHPPRLSSRH